MGAPRGFSFGLSHSVPDGASGGVGPWWVNLYGALDLTTIEWDPWYHVCYDRGRIFLLFDFPHDGAP